MNIGRSARLRYGYGLRKMAANLERRVIARIQLNAAGARPVKCPFALSRTQRGP